MMYAVYDPRGRPIKDWLIFEDEAKQYFGGEESIAEVTKLGNNYYSFKIQDYYSSFGVLKMEITQPLERAIKTFGALLMADSVLEDAACGVKQQAKIDQHVHSQYGTIRHTLEPGKTIIWNWHTSEWDKSETP